MKVEIKRKRKEGKEIEKRDKKTEGKKESRR